MYPVLQSMGFCRVHDTAYCPVRRVTDHSLIPKQSSRLYKMDVPEVNMTERSGEGRQGKETDRNTLYAKQGDELKNEEQIKDDEKRGHRTRFEAKSTSAVTDDMVRYPPGGWEGHTHLLLHLFPRRGGGAAVVMKNY